MMAVNDVGEVKESAMHQPLSLLVPLQCWQECLVNTCSTLCEWYSDRSILLE